jgi:serine/threonine protein kinase
MARWTSDDERGEDTRRQCTTVCYSFPSLPFDESAAFTPPAAFGPYRVLHQIGSGVLGPVFRTYDPHQDRLVAVKAFRLDVVPETVAKLADSLRRIPASGMTNPAIVQVLDAGLEGMSAYLAMEYVSAETLDVALRHLAPAPLDRALPMLTDLAKAIEAAWAAGCGHGAIHPRDVFVLSGTNDVRLTGCGVVPALESAGIKSPPRRPYSAPERGTADSWDIRADIYSLGVLAHELLTKRRPAGANEQDGSLATGTTPEARVLIRRVLAAALADRPDERFATPTAFVDALGAIVRGEPLGALPEGANTAEERPAPSSRKNESAPLLALAEAASAEAALPVVPSSAAPAPDPPGFWAPAPAAAADAPAPATSARRQPVAPARPASPPVEAPPSSAAPPGRERLAGSTGSAGSAGSDRGDRSGPMPRPSPPPLRASPPPVIVPMRTPFPWAAVLAAAVAGGALFGVAGYRIGLGRRPLPVAEVSQPAPPPGTDVAVPPPLVPAPEAKPPKEAAGVPETTAAPHGATRPVVAPRPKIESVVGSLLVESRPAGARVVLDGKSLGVTPLTVPDVRVGSHPLRLERAGYKTLVTSVVIKSGERARIAVTLELSGALGSWMPPLR